MSIADYSKQRESVRERVLFSVNVYSVYWVCVCTCTCVCVRVRACVRVCVCV